MTNIELQAIDPSPFQRRQHFEEDKLKGLAASIQRDGLIEPIVVRPNGKRYQRKNLSAIVEIADAELIEDKEYAAMGKTPADRMKTLLGKLHSLTSSKNRGSQVSGKGKSLLRKFAQQVEKIFLNLPKPLEWRSFYRHDLPILMDFCEEVRDVSIRTMLYTEKVRSGIVHSLI
ncbi:MAG: ParB N-terminal domain-containing protein [Desulfobacteraceae bacterium]|nr:ParB N-terminal domain-containing protein [Desulfobacteraceae bacterium]